MFIACMACGGGDDTPDASLRDAVIDAIETARLSSEMVHIDTGLDKGQVSRYRATGTWPLWRLLRLPAAFWVAFLPWLASRYGLAVVSVAKAHAVDAVLTVARAGVEIHPKEKDRVAKMVFDVARIVDPQQKSA